jgi:hypothetical protein
MTAIAFNSQATGPKGNGSDSTKKRRAGIMKAIIGSNHTVKGADGRVRNFVVREYSQYPKAKVIARCLYCRKDWPTADELFEAHPGHNVMLKQGEAHVIALWSEDPLEAPDPNVKGGKVDPGKVIGFLSDEHATES